MLLAARGSRSTRETAARLGIERGDIVEVHDAGGTVARAGLPLSRHSSRHRRDRDRPGTRGATRRERQRKTTAMTTQWGYGRYARDIGVARSTCSRRDATRAGGSRSRRRRRRSRRPASIARSSPPKARRASTAAASRRRVAGRRELARRGRPSMPHGGRHDIPGDCRVTSSCRDFARRSPPTRRVSWRADVRRSRKDKGMYDPNHWSGHGEAPLGDDDRPRALHRMLGVRHGVLRREQHPDGRRAVAERARVCAVATAPGSNITRGREMAWMRIERYFEGGEDGDSPRTSRRASCRCSASTAATRRASRCVRCTRRITRPTASTCRSTTAASARATARNNCPYKVRYFNWFGYGEPDRQQYAFPEPLNWQLNPDVTVRGKGVMEKCTFCVQRIREAENAREVGRTRAGRRTSSRRRARRPVRRARSCSATRRIRALDRRAAGRGPARLPRVRGAQHLHRGGLLEEGQPSGAGDAGQARKGARRWQP